MRNLLPQLVSSLLLASTLLSGSQAHAQSAPKIATIDLKRVFDNYWKTKQADSTLKERATDFDKAQTGMKEDYQKASDDYKKLMESANDVAVSSEEKEKRKQAAEKKLLEIREIESSLQTFVRQSRTTLGEQQRRMRDKILGEIKEIINSSAKAESYTMIVDTAAETPNQTPIFLFWDGKSDITEKVLTQLNATAPAAKENTDKADDKKEKPEDKK